MNSAEFFRDFILPVAILMVAVVALWRERRESKKEGEAREAKHEVEMQALRVQHDAETKAMLAENMRLHQARFDEERLRGSSMAEAVSTAVQALRNNTEALNAARKDRERGRE